MPTTLASLNPSLLPDAVAAPIFSKINESSAVMQQARKVPLALDANTVIPVQMDIPVPGWVSEGGAKPVGNTGVTMKLMSGKKLAILWPVSEELYRTNPGGLYDQMRQDLPVGFARAFDFAAIHGKDLRTNSTGPFGDYLASTPNSVELGTTSQANGGMYTDLVKGEEAVVDAGFDFTGFAADPRLRPALKQEVDSTGRPLWVDAPAAGMAGATLIGYSASYNRGVSGTYRRSGNRVQVVTITGSPTGGTFTLSGNGATTATIAYNAANSAVQTAVRTLGGPFAAATVSGSAGGPYTVTLGSVGVASAPLTADGSALTGGTSPDVVVAKSPDTDSGLRAIGGDWSQAAWGQGMAITYKESTEASYVDESGATVSAFQNNLVLLLIEAHFGFVMGDASAFVAYTDAF